MALIKCPECGTSVSSEAPTCVRCGYPLKQNTVVSINTTVQNPPPGGVPRTKVTVKRSNDGELIWQGKVGDIITINCKSGAMVVDIKIHGFFSSAQKGLMQVTIQPGKKYQIINTPGVFFPTHFSLAETDILY
ncbi:MAG: zinc ribbon domain-containing protein [Ruminococcus sp.]|nr:zinc ribbon domain-containing protein [Ruminococcus sp.]